MMRSTTRLLALAAAAPLALGTLGACSKTDTPTSTTGTTGKPAGSTAASAPAGSSTTVKPTGTTGKTSGSTVGTTTGTAMKGGKVTLKVVDSPFGKAIGAPDGKVVYTWDTEIEAKDEVKCTGACLEKWPPVYADSVEAGPGLEGLTLSVITRPDGSKQAALNGHPLYEMAADEPGDANCQGESGWWIAKPDGTKNTTKP